MKHSLASEVDQQKSNDRLKVIKNEKILSLKNYDGIKRQSAVIEVFFRSVWPDALEKIAHTYKNVAKEYKNLPNTF